MVLMLPRRSRVNLGPQIPSRPARRAPALPLLSCPELLLCYHHSAFSVFTRQGSDRGTDSPAGLERAPQLMPPLEAPGRSGGMVFKIVECHSATTDVARTLTSQTSADPSE